MSGLEQLIWAKGWLGKLGILGGLNRLWFLVRWKKLYLRDVFRITRFWRNWGTISVLVILGLLFWIGILRGFRSIEDLKRFVWPQEVAIVRPPAPTFTSSLGRKILNLTDTELDLFIEKVAPPHQFLVIYLYNSKTTKESNLTKHFETHHFNANKLRSRPCQQSKEDKFRIFKYDLSSEKLLRQRHNLFENSFLIYQGGKLLWSGEKFNGYSNSIHDLKLQIKTCEGYLGRGALPPDFKFGSGSLMGKKVIEI